MADCTCASHAKELAEDLARVSRRLDSARTAATKAHDATCGYCNRPASCFGGMAEGGDDFAYACDECCGHGNEDGWCEPIASKSRDAMLAEIERVLSGYGEALMERDEARAEVGRRTSELTAARRVIRRIRKLLAPVVRRDKKRGGDG